MNESNWIDIENKLKITEERILRKPHLSILKQT